jgi:hypothetical protein
MTAIPFFKTLKVSNESESIATKHGNLSGSIKLRKILSIGLVHSFLTINWEAGPILVQLHTHTSNLILALLCSDKMKKNLLFVLTNSDEIQDAEISYFV